MTNRFFYKDNYNVEQFYDELNSLVRSTINLRVLLHRSAELIQVALKAEYVSFFVHSGDARVIFIGTEDAKRLPPEDIGLLDELNAVVSIEDHAISPTVRRMLVSHRIAVVVPLHQNDALVGMMCLGEHKTSQYTRRDLRLLRTVAGELAIGIQNTLSVQEIRDLNENLQQRIDAATKELRRSNAQLQKLDQAKDEFISMASHQLRTPLTSIKGYISMLMEGDVGKVSPEQKHLLQEAFVSSERMVRLIGDFLNVSRLQTGKFIIEKRPVDLAKLVRREIDGLESNAAARNIKFVYKQPKDIPAVDVDENKIQQVIMNFADNAIYYSKEASKIVVRLQKTAKGIEFTVKDTGIGVPLDEQAQLFNKFFRATNARRQRPDGTGVGLYLAKRVVQDHHGEIIFSSKEGKGSTFGFRLPLQK
ncbi:GAF domain-containing protein [Candidatus Saccharibacteria bacterium]|nr:GAF domain-containing protein [Candidatus Saccharibacteria bacterium]